MALPLLWLWRLSLKLLLSLRMGFRKLEFVTTRVPSEALRFASPAYRALFQCSCTITYSNYCIIYSMNVLHYCSVCVCVCVCVCACTCDSVLYLCVYMHVRVHADYYIMHMQTYSRNSSFRFALKTPGPCE